MGIYGLLAGIATFSFGSWDQSMTLLMIMMGADYITGILSSIKEGKGIRSSVSFWGLIKKALMLLSILIAHHLDLLFGSTNEIMKYSVYFWIANEGLSLTENYGRLGLPLPDIIKDKIAILKGKKEENKETV